ncbi:MAG TPA: S26 family signal peptidase [archaeon]|nr:S26 family signal peptidase [archaeon]
MWPFTVFRIEDKSMEPYLKSGDYVIVNKIAYAFKNPVKNDVVVLKHRNRFLVKRVGKILEDRYFVKGDNVKSSKDSRHFGPVDKKSIVGKVLFISARPVSPTSR